MANSSSDVRIKHGCPKSDPAYWLDCISALFRNVEGLREDANGLGDGAEVPLLRLVRQIWPCVLRVMERYLAKVHVMERATRTVRFFFRALRLHMRPLLETIATKVSTSLATPEPGSRFTKLSQNLKYLCSGDIYDFIMKFPMFNVRGQKVQVIFYHGQSQREELSITPTLFSDQMIRTFHTSLSTALAEGHPSSICLIILLFCGR